jgi:plastocyanin
MKSNPTKPGTTGGELNGSLPSTGSQYAHTFANAGTFNYKCTIHPTCASLAGTIVVLAPGGVIQNRVLGITQSGGSSGPYGSTCASFSLQLDSVLVGDKVTWTNNSPLPHTVTSQ